jgi:hypothetical protein
MHVHDSPRIIAQVPTALLAQNTATVARETIGALRRETVLNNARQRRKRPRPNICVLMLRDLRKFLRDKYDKHGDAMPEGDDGALDDFIILLNYVAMLGDYRALRAAKARWMPLLDEATFDAMVAQVVHSPLYLSPDALGERIGLYDAKRTELKIKTIGAIDCNKAQRIERRHGRKLAKRKAKRAALRDLRPVSASEAKPWVALGMSRASWYAKGKPTHLDSGQNMAPNKLSLSAGCQVLSKQSAGASPSGDLTRSVGVEAYTAPDGWALHPVRDTGVAVLVPEPSAAAALVQSQALVAEIVPAERGSAIAGRLCFHWIKKNPFHHHSLPALALEMGRAAA